MKHLFKTIVLTSLLVVFSFSTKASTYEESWGIEYSFTFSPDISNQDEIEFGIEPGDQVSFVNNRYYDHYFLSFQLFHIRHALHGYNAKGLEKSLDGEYLKALGVKVGFLPYYELDESKYVFFGPYVGLAGVEVLDDIKILPFAEIETGIGFELSKTLIFETGYRYSYYMHEEFKDAELKYDTHTVFFRFSHKLKY